MKISSPLAPLPKTSSHVPAVLEPAAFHPSWNSGNRGCLGFARYSISSVGTGLAKAAPASGERSRASPSTPTSFSTCTMITRWVRSTSRVWRIRAAKARASACRLFGLSVESTSTVLPPRICARGKRSCAALTQAGAKLESPFFQLPNQIQTICTLFWRALSMSWSTRRKSYFPSSGSIQSHETPVRMVFMWTLPESSGHTTFMRSVSEETVLLNSPPSTRKGLPSTINCVAWPRFSRCGIAGAAGLLCARATRASAHGSNAQVRNLALIMFFYFKTSFHRYAPHIGEARFAGGALHFEDGGVVPPGFVLVHGMLFVARGAVAEIPFPGCDLAFGFVLEGHQAAVHIRDFVRPFGLDGFLELRLQRHEPEAQIAGIAEHGLLVGEIPESDAIARVDVVVIDHAPREADQLVLGEDAFHGALRAVAGGVVEGRDIKLQHQLAALAGLEIIVVGGVGVGQALDVLRATPGHRPDLVAGGVKMW